MQTRSLHCMPVDRLLETSQSHRPSNSFLAQLMLKMGVSPHFYVNPSGAKIIATLAAGLSVRGARWPPWLRWEGGFFTCAPRPLEPCHIALALDARWIGVAGFWSACARCQVCLRCPRSDITCVFHDIARRIEPRRLPIGRARMVDGKPESNRAVESSTIPSRVSSALANGWPILAS